MVKKADKNKAREAPKTIFGLSSAHSNTFLSKFFSFLTILVSACSLNCAFLKK